MKRIGKVIARATTQSLADKPIAKDIEKLLPAEKRLYDLVLQGIEAAKTELLAPILYPDSEKIAVWPEIVEQKQIPANIQMGAEILKKAIMTASEEGAGKRQDKSNIDEKYAVVRILKDLPTFTGADGRNYTVNAEEVVVLPQLNAAGLVKRNAAKLINGQGNSEKS
jgi:DNA replication factor GINS